MLRRSADSRPEAAIASLVALMTTKEIRTSQAHVSCDVCGRTLLRGEHAEVFVAGGHKRDVCDLCQPRALHEGWVREGTVLERGTGTRANERRRVSFIRRWRRSMRRDRRAEQQEAGLRANGDHGDALAGVAPGRGHEPLLPEREVRHVHAVPTSAEQRIATAIDLFNHSAHPRTVAGVARSLGEPVVVARPDPEASSIVTIVVSWELCWYRYEVDLDGESVRSAGQGYELEELELADRVEANARADEDGFLSLL